MTNTWLELQRRLSELLATYDVPGASAALLVDDEVVDAAAGVVNNRTGVEARPDSPFMIQSVTKVWTASLVMQLVDEGRVSLDDPVRRHLPGFRTADEEQSAAITVRHLLTHTAGFEGDIWAETTAGADALERFVADQVARAPQYAAPGQMYSYCSAGWGTLGRLIEVLRGTTYAVALRRQLLEPLGVEGAVFDAGEAVAYRTAIGHVRASHGEPLRPLPTWAVMPPSNPAAGNQLAMPARGLLALARLHLNEGRAVDGTQLLSAESVDLMRRAHVDVPASLGGAAQGFGWRLSSDARVVEHGGDAPGNGAALVAVPDRGVAVAVVANGGDMSGLIGSLCDDLLVELADIAPTAPRSVPEPEPVGDVARYLGRYELRNEVTEVTADESSRLHLTVTERNEAAAMTQLAGARVEPQTAELRRIEGETFLRVDEAGRAMGTVEFVGTDDAGRAGYLHTGRAAPRDGRSCIASVILPEAR